MGLSEQGFCIPHQSEESKDVSWPSDWGLPTDESSSPLSGRRLPEDQGPTPSPRCVQGPASGRLSGWMGRPYQEGLRYFCHLWERSVDSSGC